MKQLRPTLSDEFFQVPKKEKKPRKKISIDRGLLKKVIVISAVVLCLAAVIYALVKIKVPIDYSEIEEKLHVGYNSDSGVFFAAWYKEGAKPISGHCPEYDITDDDNKVVYESYYTSLEISLFHQIFSSVGYYALDVFQHEVTDFKFEKDGTVFYRQPINEGARVGRIYYRDGDGTDHVIWENNDLSIEKEQ